MQVVGETSSRTVYVLQGEGGRGEGGITYSGIKCLRRRGTVYFRGGSLTPEYVVLGRHFTPE